MSPTRDPVPDDQDVPVTGLSRGRLIDVLSDTVSDLDRLNLALDADGVNDARRLRSSLIGQVRDHVLPRLQGADVPAIVVVGGSTGAGKSTLVNSVLAAEVSDAGVLRPTTRVPVLVANPEDIEAFDGHPVAEISETVISEAIPAGLALIDASDLDSVQEANRALANRLLEATDLWLFVTTAARYGDHTPWSSLEDAARRGMPIAVVLNRVPAKVLSEVRRDLVARLDALGLAESPFFVVRDAGPHEGLLPAESVAEIHDWLTLLAGRHRAAGLVRRTDRGLWRGLRTDLVALAEAVDVQADAAQRLERASQELVTTPVAGLRSDVELGVIGEGAPATRWVSQASSGGPLASLAQGGRLGGGWFGRSKRARTQSLSGVVDDLIEAAELRLSAAQADLQAKARTVWEEAGADESADRLIGRGPSASEAVAAWVRSTRELIESSVQVKGLEPRAAADLVIVAACGVEGAMTAAGHRGLGPQAEAARQALSQALTDAVHAVVPAGAAASLAPDPGLAAALRLRSGELAPLVRPGAAA